MSERLATPKGRIKLLSGICIAAVLTLTSCSPNASGPVAEATGTEQATRAPDFTDAGLEALDATMKSAVDMGEVYGLSYVLATGEGEIQRNYFGVQSLTTERPIQKDTIFRIYSMSKPITGVAMMMLWEEGKWKLDDPVTKYVPEFEGLKVLDGTNEDGTPKLVNVDRPPTMQEVMSHTAGFAYGLGGTDYANEQFREQAILRSPDMETFINKVASVPLLFQPGTDWSYSAAVDVQGYIVEKLSGQSFGSFLQERVFAPLGMKDTGFFVPEDKQERLSDVFTWYEKSGKVITVTDERYKYREGDIPFESGGGGLASTLDDYAHFSEMLLHEGNFRGTQLLKPETIRLMATNVLPEGKTIWSNGNSGRSNGSAGQGFGLDFGIVFDPEAANSGQGKGTFYWGGAAGTWFWIDPVNDLYFVGMIQRFSGNPDSDFDVRAASRKEVYGAIAK